MTDVVYRWPTIIKDPDETLPVSLGLFALCASLWTPNEEYDAGEFVWPNITVRNGQIVKGANGYCYECTAPGRTGSKEPKWNTVADAVLATLDGSVQWTCRVGGSQGITGIGSAAVGTIQTTDGVSGDLTASAPLIDEQTKLLVDYAAGTLGMDYEVEFDFQIAGRNRVGRQLVQVRKK